MLTPTLTLTLALALTPTLTLALTLVTLALTAFMCGQLRARAASEPVRWEPLWKALEHRL